VNRPLNKIISIFFILTLLFAPLLPGAGVLVPGMELSDASSDFDHQFLRSVLRQLDRYARTAGVSRMPERITIVCNRDDRYGFYGKNRLYLPGNAQKWLEDISMRRKVYSALAAARFNSRFSADSPGLPEWIVCGIDAEIAAGAASGQYLTANRNFELLSAIAGHTGNIPDFRIMCQKGIPEDPVMREFFAEQARILLHITARNGRIKELFQGSSGGKTDYFIALFSSAGEAANSLADDSETLLWNQHHPMPVKTARERLAELEHIFVTEVDENGESTGNFKEITAWQDFAATMAPPRKNRNALKGQFATGFIRLGKMLSIQEKQLLGEMAGLVSGFGESGGEAEKRFAQKLHLLQQQLSRREKVERFLRDTLTINTPLPDNFRLLFEAVSGSGRTLTPEENNFLQQTINQYLL